MSWLGHKIWPPAPGGAPTKNLSKKLTHLTILVRYNSLTVDGVAVVSQCLVAECCSWVGEVRQFLSQWVQGRRHPSIKLPKTDLSLPGFELRLPASQSGSIPKSYLDSLHI
jgi:hypothetical protein